MTQRWTTQPDLFGRHMLRLQGHGLLKLSFDDLERLTRWADDRLATPAWDQADGRLYDRLAHIVRINRDMMIVFMLLEMWWGGLG